MKNNASMIFVLAAASILLHTGSGDAAPTVSLELSGKVTEISAIGFGGRDDSLNFQSVVPFEVGDPVTGRVSWDPTVFPTPLNGRIDFRPGNFLLRVGATDFTAEQISINTSFPPNPRRLQVTPGRLNFLPDGWSSDFSGRLASSALTLRDDTGKAFADNSPRLETSPTAADLDSIDFVIFEDLGFHTWITPIGSHSGFTHTILFDFDQLSVVSTAVPEPSGCVFFSLVSMLMIFFRPQRRRFAHTYHTLNALT